MNAKGTLFLFFLLVGFTFFGCKNDDQEIPLQEFKFSITQNGNQLYHSWTEVNISNFDQYVIVRSTENIPLDLDPFLSPISNSEINRIVYQESSKSISEWEEIVLSEETKLYYRVFLKLSDRYIVSNEVGIDFDKKLVFNSAQNSDIEVFHHPDLKLIYHIDVDSIFAYDYQSNNLVAATALPSTFYAGLFSYGKFNGQDEIYLIPQGPDDDEIIVLDAINLNFIETINTGYGTINAINTEREGVIVIFKNGASSLEIFDRLSGNEIVSTSCSCSSTYNKRLGFASNIENTIKVFFSDGIREGGFIDFVFSESWEFISESPRFSFQSSVLPKIAYSSNKEYFIPNYNGAIYESDGSIFNSVYDTIENRGTSYSYVFLENESTLLNIDDHSLFSNSDDLRTIDKYSFPEVELIDSWRIPKNFNSSGRYEFFYDGENLLLVYYSIISGYRKVIILPLNL